MEEQDSEFTEEGLFTEGFPEDGVLVMRAIPAPIYTVKFTWKVVME